MGRIGMVVGTAVLLSGCALPIGIQMASLAIQGMSLAATNKTITDHGISLVADQDCALWRGLTGDSVCTDPATLEGPVAVATLEPPVEPLAPSAAAGFVAPAPVASAPPPATTRPALRSPRPPLVVASWGPAVPREERFAVIALDDFQTAAGTPGPDVTLAASPPTASFVPAAEPITAHTGDLYHVIGSFQTLDRAARLVAAHPGLQPTVLRAEVKGGTYYRVAVGPFAPGDRVAERRRLRASGIQDAWALPYDASRWHVIAPSAEPVRFAAMSPVSRGF